MAYFVPGVWDIVTVHEVRRRKRAHTRGFDYLGGHCSKLYSTLSTTITMAPRSLFQSARIVIRKSLMESNVLAYPSFFKLGLPKKTVHEMYTKVDVNKYLSKRGIVVNGPLDVHDLEENLHS